MDLQKQELFTEQSCHIAGSRAVLEGTLQVPSELGEAACILEVTGQAETDEVRVEDGAAAVTGSARFTVLYRSTDGELVSFAAQCRLEHTLEAEGLSADMGAFAQMQVEQIEAMLADARSISLTARLGVDVIAACNRRYALLDPDGGGDGLQRRLAEVAVPVLEGMRTVRTGVSETLRIPQNLPPAREVLLSRGYALVTDLHPEGDRLAVEGELRMCALYLSADKNAPLQVYSETLPFGEILPELPCGDPEGLLALAQLEQLSAEIPADDPDALQVEATIAIGALSRSRKSVRLVSDAYHCRRTCSCERQTIWAGERRSFAPIKKIVRLSALIPEDAPDVVRVLYAAADPEITALSARAGRLLLSGTAHCRLCYTTAQAGIRSVSLSLPLETELAAEGMREGALPGCRLFAEYAQGEGSGRELEIKLCLEAAIWEELGGVIEAVSGVELGEAMDAPRPGISIYFAGEGETPWDIAARLRVPAGAFVGQLPPPDQSLTAGERLILVRR